MSDSAETPNLMEALVSLAKRRGFIYASSEIYGGLNGFFDYGPLGTELKRNIRDCWWRDMVQRRDDIVGIETSIIMHPKVWEASGHVAGFSDPLVDCKASKQRYRADQLFFAEVVVDGKTVGYVSALESENTAAELQAAAETLKRKKGIQGSLASVGFYESVLQDDKVLLVKRDLATVSFSPIKDMTEAKLAEIPLIPSPATGEPGSLTAPRAFNMMFQTNVGAMTDASSVAYLRPETAQGMFVDFKNVVDTTRVKLPFGIAQIGKSFRNEITPRNFIFRSREFEQMEMEYFIHEDADWAKCARGGRRGAGRAPACLRRCGPRSAGNSGAARTDPQGVALPDEAGAGVPGAGRRERGQRMGRDRPRRRWPRARAEQLAGNPAGPGGHRRICCERRR